MSQDFLVELGTEELPPKTLLTLSNAFLANIETSLKELKLTFDRITPYATPRRLAVLVHGLAESTPTEDVVIWGPPVKVAFDNEGKPSKAAIAFANKNNVELDKLATENDGKIDKLVFKTQAGGDQTSSLLNGIINHALSTLPIAKRMRWGSNRHEFVRPVQWLVMLFGDEIVDASVFGHRANRSTRGHRFHYNQTLDLESANDYVGQLKKIAYVIADFTERKDLIRKQLETEAEKCGGHAVIDEELLNEVTALVEWPVALIGRFEERFLSVPSEALISSMKEHQKYFHVVDKNNRLLAYFITVSNIESKDPKQVIDGNERVIRPRLADAAFFFETDKKTSLKEKREALKKVVFQAKLGTLYEKTERIASLAADIASNLKVKTENVIRAGELCKSDLVSEMVLEFSDMQGIAGYYYAQHDGEHVDVAQAMNEHYLPRFARDELPATETGAIIALADRLDTLVGIFSIGQQPTGSKDPFALRRASLAVLRILVESRYDLDLKTLLTHAVKKYTHIEKNEDVIEPVLNYMLDRFRSWYEEQTIPVAVFQSVNAKQLSHPLDIDERVQAVNHFRQLPEADALAAANKRVANILAKTSIKIAENIDSKLLIEDAEIALVNAIKDKQEEVNPLFDQRQYKEALSSLASLRDVIDQFFVHVMVMTDDEALKNNRLALLQQLRNLFFEVADISYLVPSK